MPHKSDDMTPFGGDGGFGWNEVQFLEIEDLRRMAPPIVGLEIRRLTDACRLVEPGSDLYNTIVGARYELRRFLEVLADVGVPALAGAGLERECAAHLRTAIDRLGVCREKADGDVLAVVEYAADRMSHILERMRLLY